MPRADAVPAPALPSAPPRKAAKLEVALAALDQLELAALRLRWRTLTGRDAPPTFRAPLLRATIAYKLQERAQGGLKASTRRLLHRVADAADPRSTAARGGSVEGKAAMEAAATVPSLTGAGEPVARRQRRPTEPLRIKPGTRLLRTWQGSTHEVLVGEAGVVTYRGQPFRSLSEVARTITGQRWSGPLFFGLKRRSAPSGEV